MMTTPPPVHHTVARPVAAIIARDTISVSDMAAAPVPPVIDYGLTVNTDKTIPSKGGQLPVGPPLEPKGFLSADDTHVRQIVVPIYTENWSNRLEREYQILLEAEALEESTPEESARFAHLQRMRRALKNPRTPEEAMFEARRDIILDEAIAALTKYVRFIKLEAIQPSIEVQAAGRARRKS